MRICVATARGEGVGALGRGLGRAIPDGEPEAAGWLFAPMCLVHARRDIRLASVERLKGAVDIRDGRLLREAVKVAEPHMCPAQFGLDTIQMLERRLRAPSQ